MTQFDMTSARKAMIDSQLRTSGVNDEFVLARMNAVAREEFVPESAKAVAYMDRAIPLGEGRYLSSPLVHGKMLAEAAPKSDDRVLVVENGSSYLAELIRPLVAEVDTIAADKAAGKGSPRKTYSLILVDGAIEEVPAGLAKRLDENGRIVTGVVARGVTRLATGRKVAGSVALQPQAEIGIPVLHQFDKPKGWSF
ncbi:protein-L-isoaspartate(D-aspartate) O-methyltransferase [Altererythrobacter xiamenensis]|uniref:Protein-L-isoaspartate O-methyltransferase n=2 Tax=Altererythrobacter xiamenensis TaxID=1316679 RepID=A0A1Y6F2C3_9SPHN|nr:protein-L-isoaspartate(D-aspartate) O-methyltransferase [Altererythrobacter xiamenensis]